MRTKNPVLCFKTPRLPSAETLSPETFSKRVYTRPLFIDRGTPELNRKLRDNPDLLKPTAADTERLLLKFPPEERDDVRKFLTRPRADNKSGQEIADRITPEIVREVDDEMQLGLPPGLRRWGWTPSKQTKKRLLARRAQQQKP